MTAKKGTVRIENHTDGPVWIVEAISACRKWRGRKREKFVRAAVTFYAFRVSRILQPASSLWQKSADRVDVSPLVP